MFIKTKWNKSVQTKRFLLYKTILCQTFNTIYWKCIQRRSRTKNRGREDPWFVALPKREGGGGILEPLLKRDPAQEKDALRKDSICWNSVTLKDFLPFCDLVSRRA